MYETKRWNVLRRHYLVSVKPGEGTRRRGGRRGREREGGNTSKSRATCCLVLVWRRHRGSVWVYRPREGRPNQPIHNVFRRRLVPEHLHCVKRHSEIANRISIDRKAAFADPREDSAPTPVVHGSMGAPSKSFKHLHYPPPRPPQTTSSNFHKRKEGKKRRRMGAKKEKTCSCTSSTISHGSLALPYASTLLR